MAALNGLSTLHEKKRVRETRYETPRCSQWGPAWRPPHSDSRQTRVPGSSSGTIISMPSVPRSAGSCFHSSSTLSLHFGPPTSPRACFFVSLPNCRAGFTSLTDSLHIVSRSVICTRTSQASCSRTSNPSSTTHNTGLAATTTLATHTIATTHDSPDRHTLATGTLPEITIIL